MKLLPVLALLSGLVPVVAAAWDTKINDNHPSVIYSTAGDEGTGPTWFIGDTSNGNPTDYMNDEHYSNFTTSPVFQINGADLVVNFTGTGITWIGKIGPNFGMATYSVDGGPPMVFDGYYPTLVTQHRNVVIPNLANGSHSLKIEVTPFKNPSSSDYYQVIDAFNITGSPLPLYQGAVAGYNSPELSFDGMWTCGADPSGNDLSGGHCWADAANASVSWTFTGSLVEVFGRPDAEDGIFKVLIDGTEVGQVDGHFGAPDIDQLNGYGLFQAKVAPGTHTIQIVNTGMGDSDALGTFTQIDMFVAFP
jgi:trimeric autotransporter adhesin